MYGLEKSVLGVAAVDLKDRSCRKEVGNPVVTSVDVQATEGLIRNTTVYREAMSTIWRTWTQRSRLYTNDNEVLTHLSRRFKLEAE